MATAALAFVFMSATGIHAADASALTLERTNHWLIVHGPQIPGGKFTINYLEAYCRAGSTDADWMKHTVIKHKAELLSISDDKKTVKIKDTLADGVTVGHTITAGDDEVDFRLVAHNPGATPSEAHWAQACPRLGDFTGFNNPRSKDLDDYLPKCFIFLDGKLTRMPTREWTKTARYTPGQTWCPRHVPRTDVNPRPLSPLVPSNGLIGCFSGDEKLIWATAWEPYQELFQGIIRCLHADFRLGGLQPGETKRIRGKIYIVPNDMPALLRRYEKDFPEHGKSAALVGAVEMPRPARSGAPVSPPAISVSQADIQRLIARIVEEQKQPGACEFTPGIKFNRQALVSGVYLVGGDANETNVAVACAIPTLEHLELIRTRRLTESSFEYLRNARQLKVLALCEACPAITAGIIRKLSALQNLRRLEIEYSQIEPGALQLLSRMPHLEVVHLYDCGHLKFVPMFTFSVTSSADCQKPKPGAETSSQLDDRDFAALLECKQLREIHVCDMRLSERAIRAAAGSRSLRRLDLSGNGFSHEAVEWLRSHSQIKVVTHPEEEHWLGTLGFWAESEERP